MLIWSLKLWVFGLLEIGIYLGGSHWFKGVSWIMEASFQMRKKDVSATQQITS